MDVRFGCCGSHYAALFMYHTLPDYLVPDFTYVW